MKIQRTKNAARNIFFGILYKAVAMLFPFTVRTTILYILGSEYIGLSSLFTSILSFLSLAELGIGHALVYSMYKPIAEDDTDTICALLNLYRKLYRYIGFVILSVGIVLLPFLKYMIKGSCPADINLYALYLIYLFNTVISYWMFAYKQSLLSAFQRSDIISKRAMILQTFMYTVQIVSLFLFRNYYIYILWLPIITIATNLANAVIANKMFPEYKCYGHVSKELEGSIRKKALALFGTKANAIVLHAADNIVISAFLGLVVVGQYGNYYYIINSLIGIMSIFYSSLTAGIGNSLETENLEKNYKDYNELTFINTWMTMFCTISLFCLYQPFMKLWVGEKLLLPTSVVILLAVYFYVYQFYRITLTYKDAAGIWWEDRLRPYVAMIINVICNIILVQFIGLEGVILSTILSLLISVPWATYTVFKYIFHRPSMSYYRKVFIHMVFTIVVCFITWNLCLFLHEGIVGFFEKAIMCVILPNILFIIVFYKTPEFKGLIIRSMPLLYKIKNKFLKG